MGKYDWAVDLAETLLTENGEAATLRRTVGGSPPDSSKPWITGTPAVTDTTVQAVFLENVVKRRASMAKQSGIFILVFSPNVRPDPALDHMVRAGGKRYSILESEPIDPDGQVIMYMLRGSA